MQNTNNNEKSYRSTFSAINSTQQQSILTSSSDVTKVGEADLEEISRLSYPVKIDSTASLNKLVDRSLPSITIDNKSQKQQVTATSQLGGKGFLLLLLFKVFCF